MVELIYSNFEARSLACIAFVSFLKCATQEDGFPGSSTSLPNSNNQTNLPQEYNDFDLGQTLEIRDGSVSNQDLCKFRDISNAP